MFPVNVKFLSTPRFIENGASDNNYGNFNLANHVGDEPSAVLANRQLLINHYNLPAEPKWLDQCHSNICVNVDSPYSLKADASTSQTPGVVCAVLTADCLPVFLCKKNGSAVGVIHAGWRGLLDGVIEASIEALDANKGEILAHLGPGISQNAFEVGTEVRAAFIDSHAGYENAFTRCNNKYMFDLYAVARTALAAHGVESITGGDCCTYSEKNQYFSYRRDGKVSGRMAHLIWMT
ncbi:MAG: peptidoglycan editing factor PgeF [Gammaproteobacteria bacterium]|nr:peptidoglycan editing factor PgeF [Gammaproteobacteria bacterium]